MSERHFGIEQKLFKEKVERDDTGNYIGALLVRQRLINHAVVKIAEEFLKPGDIVVDACAGPEGSLLAASLHGYSWIGNDISTKFAANLRKSGASRVVISDFSHAPYQDGFADGVFFIFALNNISQPASAIKESARITDKYGVIMIADCGPSKWVANIVLSSLFSKSSSSLGMNSKVFTYGIPAYFSQKTYSQAEYADFFMENSLGLTRGELYNQALELLHNPTNKVKSFAFRFQELVVQRYFEHIAHSAENAGFSLQKTGILAMTQNGHEWEVSSPIAVSTTNWIEQLMNTRKNTGEIVNSLPMLRLRADHKIVFPVLCFQKKSSK